MEHLKLLIRSPARYCRDGLQIYSFKYYLVLEAENRYSMMARQYEVLFLKLLELLHQAADNKNSTPGLARQSGWQKMPAHPR